MIYRWKINHTVIEDRRLQFNGTAISLFGHWIKWLIITLGIYSFLGLHQTLRLENKKYYF